MIRNLVVNGCSYTAESPAYVCWAKHVADTLNIANYYNLALGGAGNRYIATSTIEFLESSDLDPEETLVIVMWSGIDRQDILISPDWAQHFRETYSCVPQRNYILSVSDDIEYWLFSGGMGGSWRDNNDVKQVFDGLYRVSSVDTLYKESLMQYTTLRNYLMLHKYKNYFTSFFNQWHDTSPELKEIKNSKFSLTKNFDWSNWFFIDEQKNGFGEFALSLNQMDTSFHPTAECHLAFAQTIVLPFILKK